MVKTIISIVVTIALMIGLCLYEVYYVQTTFDNFHEVLRTLQHKAAMENASYDDGLAVREFWDEHKTHLHVWIPHTVLYEIDYQLDEAIGFLRIEDYESALPKIEVILGLSENIPDGYILSFGNIF